MATALPDDRELWDAALRADSRAFAALFDRHRSRVCRHAVRLLESEHDADEVIALAFFELWRRRADVRVVDASVLPWLLATATNLSRNSRRARARYGAVLARLPYDDPDDPAEMAAERAEARHRAERVIEGLRGLRPVDAALLTLTAVEGFAPAEAGLALGLSGTNARTRLQRARQRLRAQLPDLDPDLAREGRNA